MALLTSEISRIKAEMGFPLLSVGAEPYIGIAAYFDQVLQPYALAGAVTTSSTPVTAAASPTPQSLTLASATGFSTGDVVIVDVDSRQERATIQSLSGAAMTVQLTLAHSGTYSVTVEGGESIIREILRELGRLASGIGAARSTISTLSSSAGIKKVDEVEFFGGGSSVGAQGVDPVTQMLKLREYWRDELASVLGIQRLNGSHSHGGSEIGVY